MFSRRIFSRHGFLVGTWLKKSPSRLIQASSVRNGAIRQQAPISENVAAGAKKITTAGEGVAKPQMSNTVFYVVAGAILATGFITIGFPLNDYWPFSKFTGKEFYNTVQDKDQRNI